jgi:hypothetical protein
MLTRVILSLIPKSRPPVSLYLRHVLPLLWDSSYIPTTSTAVPLQNAELLAWRLKLADFDLAAIAV